MDEDNYRNDGSILIGSDHGFQTTQGSALANLVTSVWVTGFIQINQTNIALVDHHIHCIKLLDRNDNSTQTLAGTCGSSGYADGIVGVGKMFNSYEIQVDVRNPDRLIITNSSNSALRSVDMKTGELSTVIRSGFSHPRGMSWFDQSLLVVNVVSNCISQVSWSDDGTVSNIVVAGSTERSDAYAVNLMRLDSTSLWT